MKKFLFLFVFTLLLSFYSCHSKTHLEKNPTPDSESKNGKTVQLSDLAVDKDLVCGMKLDGESIADTASYENKNYGFCSTECKTEFLKNPQSYISQQ